jgi:HSP20 family protein
MLILFEAEHRMAQRNLVLFLYGQPVTEQDCIWEPAADIYRSGKTWIVKLDLAGVQTEDVKISQKGSALIVSGVRRDSFIEGGCTFYNLEISYSHFKRSFSFPFNLEGIPLEISAKQGMLFIRVVEPDDERSR